MKTSVQIKEMAETAGLRLTRVASGRLHGVWDDGTEAHFRVSSEGAALCSDYECTEVVDHEPARTMRGSAGTAHAQAFDRLVRRTAANRGREI